MLLRPLLNSPWTDSSLYPQLCVFLSLWISVLLRLPPSLFLIKAASCCAEVRIRLVLSSAPFPHSIYYGRAKSRTTASPCLFIRLHPLPPSSLSTSSTERFSCLSYFFHLFLLLLILILSYLNLSYPILSSLSTSTERFPYLSYFFHFFLLLLLSFYCLLLSSTSCFCYFYFLLLLLSSTFLYYFLLLPSTFFFFRLLSCTSFFYFYFFSISFFFYFFHFFR